MPHCLNLSTYTVHVFLSITYSPFFQVLPWSSNSCLYVCNGFSILQTIHLLLCPYGKFSFTRCLLSNFHNFCLAVWGLSSNFFVHFRKLFLDFNWKSLNCILCIGCLSSMICFVLFYFYVTSNLVALFLLKDIVCQLMLVLGSLYLFKVISICLVCVDVPYIEHEFSATEKPRASANILTVSEWAPHFELNNFHIGYF